MLRCFIVLVVSKLEGENVAGLGRSLRKLVDSTKQNFVQLKLIPAREPVVKSGFTQRTPLEYFLCEFGAE